MSEKRPLLDYEGKDLVVVVTGIVAIFAMFKIDTPENIVGICVAGILGIATGKLTK